MISQYFKIDNSKENYHEKIIVKVIKKLNGETFKIKIIEGFGRIL